MNTHRTDVLERIDLPPADVPVANHAMTANGNGIHAPLEMSMGEGAVNNLAPTVSVVIPVYNGAASVPELVERLGGVLPTLAPRYEVVLVNDCSRDDSWKVIRDLARRYPWVHGFNLMRNYGQHNALLCGIRATRFEVIVTMDDDLQHPPEEIAHLLAKLEQGFDVVYGTPREERHGLFRDVMSVLTKRSLAAAMGVKSARNMSAFRAFRAHLQKAFAGYESPQLVLDVLLSWGTTRFAAVPVEHQPRRVGQSNYTFAKLANQAMLIATGFSTGPLRVASLVGFTFTILGFLTLIYVVGRALMERSVPGFPFLASLIAIFSGAQMFALGIIGEYLARMFNRSLERPTYVVQETTEG